MGVCNRLAHHLTVIPAKAGIQSLLTQPCRQSQSHWIPAFVGMTVSGSRS